MNILITGADGFIAKNLVVALQEQGTHHILRLTREHDDAALAALVAQADFVFHLAGINRPRDPSEFGTGNAGLTDKLCQAIEATGRDIPVAFSSSTQASLDNPYGVSKRAAEARMLDMAARTGGRVFILRLPNVFGKWCRPNYNSVVATFCYNVARDLPIRIDAPETMLTLIHIDDVVAAFLKCLHTSAPAPGFVEAGPTYQCTLGELASRIQGFRQSRESLVIDHVGTGFIRALYATYVSYLPPDSFAYAVPQHGDPRGVFVEMLKTPDSGQFSFFTAHPGITRGGHYHHTKTEKFLVIRGKARFGFRHIVTGETHVIETQGSQPQVVETVPGWTHDITNIGDDEMIVMLWANEIFDRSRPDTIACPVSL